MAFSKKAASDTPVNSGNNGSGNGVSQEERNAWNLYQFECFNAKAKELANGKKRKEKSLIGVVSYIQDLGFPPAKDSEWTTKCALPAEGEEYSQEELDWKEKNPTHDFVWSTEYNENTKKNERVRKQTSPSFPQQEYGITVDFPQVMIDHSKNPNESMRHLGEKPLRVCLNGSTGFHSDFYKTIVFDGSYKKVSDKNLVYKICVAAGREQELISSEYDIATLAEAVCSFTVKADLDDRDYNEEDGSGKVSVYFSCSKPAEVQDLDMPDDSVFTAEQQIKKAFDGKELMPFIGALLDDVSHLEEDQLKYIAFDSYGFLKRASTSKTFLIEGVSKKTGNEYSFEKGVDYQGSALEQAISKIKGEASQQQNNSQEGDGSSKESKPAQKAPVKQKEVVKSNSPMEPPIDFDDK